MHQSNGATYIVSAARTPIGKFGGALSGVPATDARRHRHPGRRRAGGPRPGHGPDRRRPDGPGPPGRRRPGPRPAGHAPGRPPGHDQRHDDQPRLRLGPQGDHARGRRDPGRRRRARRGRRHGIHERGPVRPAGRPLRPAGSATRRSSTRPSTTACGAPSRTATWAPTPSGWRSRTRSVARTRMRSRWRAIARRSPRSTPAGSTPSSCR